MLRRREEEGEEGKEYHDGMFGIMQCDHHHYYYYYYYYCYCCCCCYYYYYY